MREIQIGAVNKLISCLVEFLHDVELVRLTWDEDSYKIFDPSRVPDGTVDIPKQVQTAALLSSCNIPARQLF